MQFHRRYVLTYFHEISVYLWSRHHNQLIIILGLCYVFHWISRNLVYLTNSGFPCQRETITGNESYSFFELSTLIIISLTDNFNHVLIIFIYFNNMRKDSREFSFCFVNIWVWSETMPKQVHFCPCKVNMVFYLKCVFCERIVSFDSDT